MQAAQWSDYTTGKPADSHTVSGDLKVLKDFYSPQLDNHRDLLVYLPADYDTGERRYPVIYMHDGQNLFDARTSFAGEWRVDETMLQLEQEGIAAIVVGIPNMGVERAQEYSPYAHTGALLSVDTGRGAAYMDFLAHTVKPLIDSDFRTRPEREHTGLMGSSLGGLISLYGLYAHPQVFGFAGVFSPAFWFGKRAIFEEIRRRPFVPGRIYMDMGLAEDSPRRWRWLPFRYFTAAGVVRDSRAMYQLLLDKGYRASQDILYVEEKDAGHNEDAWARRLPAALRFLLS